MEKKYVIVGVPYWNPQFDLNGLRTLKSMSDLFLYHCYDMYAMTKQYYGSPVVMIEVT